MTKYSLFLLFGCLISSAILAQVSISTNGLPPDNSAMLDVKSTTKGLLIPRMTTSQISLIVSPADGLQVYNITDGKLYIYVATASVWRELSYGTGTITPGSASICGNSFTDERDGQTYNTALIGTQCWMAQNLNVGTRINSTSNQADNETIEKYCYDNIDGNCAVFGGLYQWNELMNYTASSNANPSDRKGICPTGWHVPSDAEFTQLTTFLGGEPGAGGPMKETGTTHWASPNTGATNTSGFTALPGGYRDTGVDFNYLSAYGFFWSSTEYSATYAWLRSLYNEGGQVNNANDIKTYGFSLRCIED